MQNGNMLHQKKLKFTGCAYYTFTENTYTSSFTRINNFNSRFKGQHMNVSYFVFGSELISVPTRKHLHSCFLLNDMRTHKNTNELWNSVFKKKKREGE